MRWPRRPLFLPFHSNAKGAKLLAVLGAMVLGLFLSTIIKSHALTLDDKNKPHFETGIVAVPVANVRSKPTLNSPVESKLNAGDTVTFLKKRDEWYIVELHDGGVGWSHQRIFRAPASMLEDSKTAMVTLKVNVGRVRAKPSLKAKTKSILTRGKTVPLVRTKNEWYLILLEDDRLGWAHRSLFFKSHPDPDPATTVEKEIKAIEFVMTPEGKEMVTFRLNGYYPPEPFSNLGNNPTVICDFFNARLGKGVKRAFEVNGNCIYRIRTGIHIGSRPKVRVVLDLVPDQTYDIRPVFFKEENLFVLIVKKIGL
jgi:SH3-like domain-containing protein